MARVLRIFRDPEGPCAYLPEARARLDHRILLDVSPGAFDRLLFLGWRRFGPDYFRPACAACSECVPTRIPVATFSPSRSQERVRKKGAAFRATFGPAGVDEARLGLYHLWHENREDARGWGEGTMDLETYRMQFAFPHPSSREVLFHHEERLIGVSICDETPTALSAVYFFFDPAYAAYSPGTLNILTLVGLARSLGKTHVYLGFRVRGCPSLRYKERFYPQEVLEHRPGDDETPRWRTVERPA
jgi:arginine-tRNA-protein transferase